MTSVASHTPSSVSAHWSRAFCDLRREHGFKDLEVEGQIPQSIHGTLYRTGPSRFSSFGLRYQHWFDGDGAVSALRLRNGTAQGAVRLVQSEGLKAEQAAGRALFGGYGTKSPHHVRHTLQGKLKNTGNTNVMVWNERLFALMEAAKPTELDPDTLSTLGETDFGGTLINNFSAHPHHVPSRKALYNIAARFGRKMMLDLYELRTDGTGQSRRLLSLPLPFHTMVHDFLVTQDHAIIFVAPVKLKLLTTLLGKGSLSDNLDWRPELGTEVIIVPLDHPRALRRFSVDSFYAWHYANAYHHDGVIIFDAVRYPNFDSNARLASYAAGQPGGNADGHLYRGILEPSRGTLRWEKRWDRSCEFPRIAPRVETRQHRYIYVSAHSSHEAASAGPHDGLARVDMDSGQALEFPVQPGDYPSEPVFIAEPSEDDEAHGWIISLIYRASSHQSFVAIYNAQKPDEDSVAKIWFDQHLPLTFHGTWAPAH